MSTLSIDCASRIVDLDGDRVPLSRQEFALLVALARDPDIVVSKGDLLRDVWRFAAVPATRTCDTHACRLRRKLGNGWVENAWGIGYKLRCHPSQQVVLSGAPPVDMSASDSDVEKGTEILASFIGEQMFTKHRLDQIRGCARRILEVRS